MEDEITHETLTAFLDGELPPLEMERVAKLLTERPELDRWVRRQEGLRTSLCQAFSEVMASPPPQHLRTAVRQAPVSKRWLMRRIWTSWKLQIWAPAGVALAAGLTFGFLMQPSAIMVRRDGAFLARGSLAEALDQKLASAGYDGSGTRIGITFRGHDGHICRTFDLDEQTGLACHQANGWAVTILESHHKSAAGAYQMAGSELPDAVRQAAMARIAGASFDAAAEKAARDNGWR